MEEKSLKYVLLIGMIYATIATVGLITGELLLMTTVAAIAGYLTTCIIELGIAIIDLKEVKEQKKSNLKNKEPSDEESQETAQAKKTNTRQIHNVKTDDWLLEMPEIQEIAQTSKNVTQQTNNFKINEWPTQAPEIHKSKVLVKVKKR